MKIMSNCVPPKFFSFPLKEFVDNQAKNKRSIIDIKRSRLPRSTFLWPYLYGKDSVIFANASRIDNSISLNETHTINKNREHLTAVLRTLRYLGQQGLAVRGKHNEDLSKEDLINEGKFKELFDVMCKSNNTLQGLLKKHKRLRHCAQKLFKTI